MLKNNTVFPMKAEESNEEAESFLEVVPLLNTVINEAYGRKGNNVEIINERQNVHK